jgi:hypothetical protein
MTALQLDEESKSLMRAFLRNYDHQVGKVPYLTGKFTVLDSYPLSTGKFFDSGIAVVAQSVDVPTIYIEHLFPAAAEHLPAMQRTLATGLGIELRRSYDLSAIVHIDNLGEGRLLFTCVPLLYGPYGTTLGGSGFQLDPPKVVNLKAGLPVVAQSQLHEAEQRFSQYRRAMEAQEMASAQTTGKPQPSLVGSEPTPQPSPASAVAKTGLAEANSSVAPTPAGKASSHQVPAATPKAMPAPASTPPALAAVQPLQPFLTASPTPAINGRVGEWQTYRPGQMPRGRLLDVDQTADLASKGVGSETIYLRGDFTVTAARDNRAVLRPRQSLTDRVLNRGNARIIAEFPRGVPAPREGESFQRAPDRPFQIVDVRRGADGQVNIYVREVTSAE